MNFTDRHDAGRRLAQRLDHLKDQDVIVLGLPRGGVPVAAEVARFLGAPLDVILVRKLGVPFQPELGMGAIGEGDVRVVNHDVMREADLTAADLAQVEAKERIELNRRVSVYRVDRPPIDIRGRTVVIVDDGIATGSTARAACQVARTRGAARIVLAMPVAPSGWSGRFSDVADESVCVLTPSDFYGIGEFYHDFTQTTDGEVVACLAGAASRIGGAESSSATDVPSTEDSAGDPEVVIPAGTVRLHGQLSMPDAAAAIVVFVHGSGSSRHSPRNRYVADHLNHAGLATLLFDLLTEDEESDRGNVFDVALLAERLTAATDWLRSLPETRDLPIGYFGASTGAAAALWAAAQPGTPVAAVVSRGGRPDLAGQRLPAVTVPTLLIVGGDDTAVLNLNRRAAERLGGEKQLDIVTGATHLFSEPGTLEKVAELATRWFTRHLVGVRPATGAA